MPVWKWYLFFREDWESALVFRSEGEKQDHYSELKAAAESGWDFSSRWFIQNGTNNGENNQFFYIFNTKLATLIKMGRLKKLDKSYDSILNTYDAF